MSVSTVLEAPTESPNGDSAQFDGANNVANAGIADASLAATRQKPERLDNVRVVSTTTLISPAQLRIKLPVSVQAAQNVARHRREVEDVLSGRDERFLVIVGPCSIHDPAAAVEYGEKLLSLRERVGEKLCLVMRVYFEKPRTVVGWKGLVNDPHLDGSYDMETGLFRARQLLLELCEKGLPCATEFLDPITPQYFADLISWAAIGARTTESQTHREMASGLSMPVGFKNGTDGDLQTALDALRAAAHPHAFLGIDPHGQTAVVRTAGNPFCHLVLRGGRSGTNFDSRSIENAAARLESIGLGGGLIVDCSHANSGKDASRQVEVMRSVWNSRVEGARTGKGCAAIGAMIESHLFSGTQSAGAPETLRYGVSITDACLGWSETEALLLEIAQG